MTTEETPTELVIRPMQAEDLPDVLFIENASFPSPWPKSLFRRELANPFSDLFVVVVPDWGDDRVVGYIVCWLVSGDVHVHNLATHPSVRRRGIASAMLQHVLSYYRQMEAQHIYLEVREHNYPAQHLYGKFRFSPMGVRRRYYSDTGEDAIVMQRPVNLDETPATTE